VKVKPKYVVVMDGSTVLDEFSGVEGTVSQAPSELAYSHFVGNLEELHNEADCMIHLYSKSGNIMEQRGMALKQWLEK
tara:strand:+ start:970 stop:1203 length:234 start_codon:yes stop_codon:yes gene_type:complete